MAQKTLLELTTDAPERAIIKVDAKSYELRSRDDLGLKEDAEFNALHSEFSAATEAKDWNALSPLLDRMVAGVVLGIPLEVLAKLSDAKKLQIVQAFTREVGALRPPASVQAAEPLKEAAAA